MGEGGYFHTSVPVPVASGVTDISAGDGHSPVVKNDGSLWSVGANFWPARGWDDGGSLRSRAGKASYDFSVFVKNDGTAYAMGAKSSGQFGDGLRTFRDCPASRGGPVSQVAAGRSHTLFVKSDGTLWGMGKCLSGSTPIQIATDVREVAAGGDFSLFVKKDGSLWGMGENSYRQLGDVDRGPNPVPVLLATGVNRATAGEDHTLFLKLVGTLWAMGNTSMGQCADGSNYESSLHQVAR